MDSDYNYTTHIIDAWGFIKRALENAMKVIAEAFENILKYIKSTHANAKRRKRFCYCCKIFYVAGKAAFNIRVEKRDHLGAVY